MNLKNRNVFLLTLILASMILLTFNPSLAQENVIKLGVLSPLTGAYDALGQDQVNATMLAVEQINNAGGVLGKKIEVFVRDTQLDGGIALRRAKELVEEVGVDFLAGSLSGAVSRIINEYAGEQKIIYMAYCQSDMVYGEDRNDYGFGCMVTPYMGVMAVSKYAFDNLGKSWYALTADYRWGHRLLQAWIHSSGLEGGEFLGNSYVPLGTTNYLTYIPKVLSAKPDILVLNNLGADQTAAIKQAVQFGLTDRTKIVCSKTTILTAQEAGDAYDENVYGGVTFYWQLQDKYETARNFVEAYWDKYGFPPRQDGECSYWAVRTLFDAVERAGTLNSEAVSEALLSGKYPWTKGEEYFTPYGQRVTSFLTLRGKKDKTGGEGWDVVDIVAEAPGEQIIRTEEQAASDWPNIEIPLP